jgi:hypothetical protein
MDGSTLVDELSAHAAMNESEQLLDDRDARRRLPLRPVAAMLAREFYDVDRLSAFSNWCNRIRLSAR